jgi:hypothetical protein
MNHLASITTADGALPTPKTRELWSAPRLLRMGSVAALTSKVDNRGKNDGGTYPKRRT